MQQYNYLKLTIKDKEEIMLQNVQINSVQYLVALWENPYFGIEQNNCYVGTKLYMLCCYHVPLLFSCTVLYTYMFITSINS